METKETSDEMVHMKVRTFIALLISVITVTNSFSIIYQKIQRTEEQQAYNKERADRIAERKLQEAKEYYHLKELEAQLEKCKKNK
jgi:hypothetical protein